MSKLDIQPILKWVGGKRQLIKDIVPLIQQHKISTYENHLSEGEQSYSIYSHRTPLLTILTQS